MGGASRIGGGKPVKFSERKIDGGHRTDNGADDIAGEKWRQGQKRWDSQSR